MLLIGLLCSATQVFAVAEGFYLGLMFGPASNTGNNTVAQTAAGQINAVTLAKPKSSQYASRAYLGYKLNPYAGFELGGTFFSKIKFDTLGVPTCSGVDVRLSTIDIVGKGEFGFFGFEMFGKAGVAVVYEADSGPLNPDFTRTCGRTRNILKYKPTFSLGFGYDLTPSWVLDFTWTRLLIGGTPGNIDWYAVGLSYHFVNRYCGQFLCDD